MELGTTLCIIGGAVVAAGIIGAIYYKKSGSNPENLTDVFSGTANEQLVVDKLTGSDLTAWFRKENEHGKWKNVILYPNDKNITVFKLPKNIINNSGNLIIQAIFDEDNNNILKSRSVSFEQLDPKLSNALEANDGMIIVE